MCSRYELKSTAREVADLFGLDAAPAMPNTAVIRPTDTSMIISQEGPQIQPWGLSVYWTKQPMINARSETLSEKPTFRGLLQSRCLVIATAYFEWRKDNLGKKHKNTIRVADTPILAMAGLTDGERFTIVTCPPANDVANVYHRMPVILTTEAAKSWVSTASYNDIASCLAPYTGRFIIEEEKAPPPAQSDLFA